MNEDEPEFEEDSTRTKRKLFQCPVEGCIKAYTKYGNFRHHLELDIHTFKKHAQPLVVQAATEYKRILEEINEQRLFPPLSMQRQLIL